MLHKHSSEQWLWQTMDNFAQTKKFFVLQLLIKSLQLFLVNLLVLLILRGSLSSSSKIPFPTLFYQQSQPCFEHSSCSSCEQQQSSASPTNPLDLTPCKPRLCCPALPKAHHHPPNMMSRHKHREGTAIPGTAVTKVSSSLLLCLCLFPGQARVAQFLH